MRIERDRRPDSPEERDVLGTVAVGEACLEIDVVGPGEGPHPTGLLGAPQQAPVQLAREDAVLDGQLGADEVVDAQIGCHRLDLVLARRRGDNDRVAPTLVGAHEFPSLGADRPRDLLDEKSLAQLGHRLFALAAHRGIPLDGPSRRLPAEVRAVDDRDEGAHEVPQVDLAALHPIGEEGARGVARDEGAVEVEEGADTRPLWCGLDPRELLSEVHGRSCWPE